MFIHLDGIVMNDRDIVDQISNDIPSDILESANVSEIKSLIEYYKRGKQHEMLYPSYDIRYMRLAREIATWSKDPSTKVGAVAISQNNNIVLSQGYNGFPRGMDDDWRLYIKSEKYEYIVHAELNMIYNAADNGVSLKGSSVYIYGLPCCHKCAIALAQSGVSNVVMCSTKTTKWDISFEKSKDIFNEVGITYSFVNLDDM